jgi:glycosyltransferase involved in cell wall biosynthesis
MIYLDVTNACRLPLQTGIPRTSRALYQLLRNASAPLCAIAWQPFLFSYTEMSGRTQALLENPFASDSGQGQAPRDTTLPLLTASLADLALGRPRRVDLAARLQPGDTLLVTSLFPDNRLNYLQRLKSAPGRKIAIFHDAIPLADENVPGWEKRLHVAGLRVFAAMNLIICVSSSAEDELHFCWKRHQISPTSTHVVPWPVPFLENRPPFVEPPVHPKKVLYVSRLKRVKNHAVLFAACEQLWREGIGFSLELIGCEDEAKESRAILAEVKRLQAAGYALQWRGHVSDEELHAAYRGATFTVFPSLKEGFGLPILESLWHGRPVICSGKMPMGEVGRGPGCILADMERADLLALAMKELLQDEARNLALAREACARPLRTWTEYKRDLWLVLDLLP